MPSLILQTPGTLAELVSQRARITTLEGVRDIPIYDIERVIISESCNISTPLLCELLKRDITVAFTSWTGELTGILLSPSKHGGLRRSQYVAVTNTLLAMGVASLLVESKILNTRRVLQKLTSYVEEREAECINKLEYIAKSSIKSSSIAELMGYEGLAAATYFAAYATFFPENSPFEKRSKRPPLNAPNSVLSYCYTVLYGEAVTNLASIGLDPALGFLHTPEDGRFSLALDMIEPFRAVVADALALDSFSHGILHPVKHFVFQNGGVYLNKEGKQKFFVQFEKRMDREFTGQHGVRTTLRRELLTQCISVKQVVYEDAIFEPFILQ